MGSTVMSVIDVLGADRIQAMAEKLTLKTEWDVKQLATAALRNKPGDPYLDLNPEHRCAIKRNMLSSFPVCLRL